MAFMEGFKKFMGMSPLDEAMDDDGDDDMGLDSSAPVRGFGYNSDIDKMSKLDELDNGIGGAFDATASYSTTATMSSYTREESAKVVNLHQSSAQSQVVLVKPEKFEEAGSIADHLIAKRTVIVNTEAVNPDVRRRLIDFLSGVAYSEHGTIKMASNTTFVITPNTVGVMGIQVEDDVEVHDINGGYQY